VLKDFKQPSVQEDDSLWWQAEKLHRWISKDYQKRKSLINEERNEIQKKFIENETSLLQSKSTTQELETFSQTCLITVKQALARWNSLIRH